MDRIDGGSVLVEALHLSRSGDVESAAQLLREARRRGPSSDAMLSLLFQLVTKTRVDDEALDIATDGLDSARTALARSTWALRRAMVLLERGGRDRALADLQLVMKLKTNDGHVEQARALLLRVAQLPRDGSTAGSRRA